MVEKQGFETSVPLIETVECIFHRLETGCQLREVPTKSFFSSEILHWNAVYDYYNKGSRAKCWEKIRIAILE